MKNKVSSLAISDIKGVEINEYMMGLFFEDINYGADGGLYAEMIENRNFEFLYCTGDKNDYHQSYDGSYGWSSYPKEDSASLCILSEEPVSKVNPHYLQVTTSGNGCGFKNKAYDGVYLEEGKEYKVSFYARAKAYTGSLKVEVTKDGTSYGSASIDSITSEWNKYEVTILSQDTVRYGDFAIVLNSPGQVEFDFISCIPSDAVLGLFREDLIQLLKDMDPGFLRFPGGCIVEGNELTNRYQWKESIGRLEDRRSNWNRWAVHGNNKENNFIGPYPHYNQTLGIGYYEYFLLSEYLGAKPIPIQNVGLACQYQSDELVTIDSKEFPSYIQDTLDLIEFANGDETSYWGKKRIEMGHKEPFYLEYIGIGNEQWETEQVDYFRRYELFEEAIHGKYPEIKLISSAGPNVQSPTYDAAWAWIREKAKDNSNFTAAIDEHYYVPPKWCYDNVNFYDNYPRDVKVFAGEYAAHLGNGMNRPELNSMEAALAEAAFMTGLERNADVVHLAAYAPLVARLGYTQWSPDLIWFDDHKAYGTPSYYVQKMYGNHMGNYTLQSQLEGEKEGIYTTVSYKEESKDIIIKVVNSKETDHTLRLEIAKGYQLDGTGSVYELKAENLEDYNTIDLVKVATIQKDIEGIDSNYEYMLPPYSFSVIRLKVK